jgi:hypothetical protein
MPAAAPPVTPAPAGAWTVLSTDGLSDIAGIQIDELMYASIPRANFFTSDGGATKAWGWNSDLAAMPHGFVYTATETGPCMVCATTLLAWPPSSGWLFVGDGYEWHGNCSYALRPQGGVYAACESSFPIDYSQRGALSFSQLDEALNVTNHVTGIRPKIVAVDRLDRILESGDAGVRWIDAHATPLSEFFSADVDGAFPLIGGGLLTADDRVVPSGSNDVQPAPDWLRGRAGGAFAVLSGRTYAFTDASCAARVYSPGGEPCGTVTFAGCRAPPRFGVDGTAIVPLCGGGWGLWKRLLQ